MRTLGANSSHTTVTAVALVHGGVGLLVSILGLLPATPTVAITIQMEYTDEGDPLPHDENPSWDADGSKLKAHFQAAKAIWESLLPGPGVYEFDFHWDDDISGLGLTTHAEPFDTFIEINPTAQWYVDPTPLDSNEYSFATAQTLYSGLTPQQQSAYFPGTPPPGSLEVGYWGVGQPGFANIAGQPVVNAQTGLDLLSTVVHEIGHVLGITETEPGEYNISPLHVGGLENVLVKEGDGGHLAGMGEIQFLMCESCGTPGRRRVPTATDVLVIAEDQGITDVRLARVGSIASGLWSDPTRWLGDSSPENTQSAYISHGGLISLTANQSVRGLLVNNGSSVLVNDKRLDVEGELNFGGGAVAVTSGGTIAASHITRGAAALTTAAGSLVQFNQFESLPATATTFNGSVEIGYGAANAQLPVASPGANSTWNIGEQLSVGIGGRSAELRITAGADVVSAVGQLGMNVVTSGSSEGYVRVDGNGSTWNVGPLQVRYGDVTAINSGRVNSGAAGVGREGGLGRATIDNGRWDVGGNLDVGAATIFVDASGTVAIRNGGEINVDGNVDVRGTPSRLSEISVRTTGTLNVDGDVVAGPHGVVSYHDNVVANGVLIGATTFKTLGGADNGAGGLIRFYNDASAGDATFTNFASSTVFGGGGSTEFRGTASAGTAEFNNLPGGTVSVFSGTTRFFDSATAANATFYNQAGRWTIAPTVEFNGDSSGGNGTFVNMPGVLGVSQGGAFVFNDRSRAGTGTYTTQGEGGYVVFNDFSTAEQAVFTMPDTIGSGNNRISFNEDSKAGTATFSMGAGSVLSFITRSSAEDASITLRTASTASFGGEFNLPRLPTVTAGTADIVVQGSSVPHAYGGSLGFSTYSTAGDALITTYGGAVAAGLGGTTRFDYEGRAGNATLITHGPGVAGAGGGLTEFARGANGDNARVITHAGGVFNIAGNYLYNVTTTGSIEGGGTYVLGGAELQTGSRNTDTTVSGQLVDPLGFNPNGKLTKVGTGTLTLAGANTYTGVTTVNGGAVNITGSLAGGVVVNSGGALAGTGSIAGAVTVNAGAVLAPGASPGTLSVGSLTLENGALSQFELGTPASDRVVASGNIVLDGTLNLSLFGGFTPAPGQSFILFESIGGSVTGMFDAINTPVGLDFDVVQNPGSLLLRFAGSAFTADFDEDGDVDRDDLAQWRGDFGVNGFSDADGDLDSDGADFLAWQRQLGSSSSVPTTTTVPEAPARTLALLLAAFYASAHSAALRGEGLGSRTLEPPCRFT